MKSYEATSEIPATPDAIWKVLTDGAGYPTWDSGVDRVEGTIAPGETIKVVSAAAPGRAFPVKVGEVESGRRMQWSGGMPLGLFRGVRTFTLSPQAAGVTRFHVREEYTGPLAGPHVAIDARPRSVVHALRQRAQDPRRAWRLSERRPTARPRRTARATRSRRSATQNRRRILRSSATAERAVGELARRAPDQPARRFASPSRPEGRGTRRGGGPRHPAGSTASARKGSTRSARTLSRSGARRRRVFGS